MCLSQIPCIFLAIVAIKTVIRDNLGGSAFARAALFIVFPFPLLKWFATIKDIEVAWLVWLKNMAAKVFPQKSIDLLEEKHKSGKQNDGKQSFYFLISNLCFASVLQLATQCFIYLQFPSRSSNLSQIFSISTSFFFTVFSGSQNLRYDEPTDVSFFRKLFLTLRFFLIYSPFVISSLVFNVGTSILVVQTENPFFLLYLPAVFLSILLPAYYPPMAFFLTKEQTLGLDPRFPNKKDFSTRSLSRGLFRAFSNFFLVSKGFGDPSLFLVLIYPLHFLVNMTTLVLVTVFTQMSSHIKLTQSPSFEENNKLLCILIICGLGLLNLVMLPFFAYKNAHLVLLRKLRSCSCQREQTYIVTGGQSESAF